MLSRHVVQSTSAGGTLRLPIQAPVEDHDEGQRRVITAFSVPQSIIGDRRQRALPRRNSEPNSKKLGKLEDEVLLRRIIELGTRGIPATRAMLRNMSNDLLTEHCVETVGKYWVDNFKTRKPEIKPRKSRP